MRIKRAQVTLNRLTWTPFTLKSKVTKEAQLSSRDVPLQLAHTWQVKLGGVVGKTVAEEKMKNRAEE